MRITQAFSGVASLVGLAPLGTALPPDTTVLRGVMLVLAALCGPSALACGAPEKRPDDGASSPRPTEDPQQKQEYLRIAQENRCPEGFPLLQGQWHFIGQTRTPEFEDQLTVTGTTFKEVMQGRPDGQLATAMLTGEIRCLAKNRVLWSVTAVEPEGAFDNHSGDAFPCDVLSGLNDSDHVLLICFFDWDLRVEAGLEFEYARMGKD
jgi:hypothetical protein